MRLLKGSRRKTETEAQQSNKLMKTGKIEKHPPSKQIDENYITPVSDETISFHPSIFDLLNRQHIKKAAMRTHGSHGPSGLDAKNVDVF